MERTTTEVNPNTLAMATFLLPPVLLTLVTTTRVYLITQHNKFRVISFR